MTDNIEERSLEDLVQNGSVTDVLRKLKVMPVTVDDENYQDYSLIITAFRGSNVKVAKFLIDQGFRVYKKSKPHAEKTPLHYALELSNFQTIQLMLLKGAVPDITAQDDTGQTPMHIAIQRGEGKILNILIDSADRKALNDMLLLHHSIKSDNIPLVKQLLKKGLSPLRKNAHGETGFCLAVKDDNLDVLGLLWQSCQDKLYSIQNSNDLIGLLFVAVILNNGEYVAELMDNGFSIDTTFEPCPNGWSLFKTMAGYSLLHCAVKYVQPDIVSFLLENQADVTHQNATGSTAFHLALENMEDGLLEGSIERYKLIKEIVELLFHYTYAQGNYVNIVNEHGISHFHVLCTLNKPKILRFYLEKGASLSDAVKLTSPMFKGYSPLHFAVKYGHRKIVEILIKAGANIEQEAFMKVTPLHIAAKESAVISVVSELIKRGADITKQDLNGNTPVHYAFETKNYVILDFLMSVHAIVSANPVNSLGISHFHIACSRGDVSIVANFLLNKASVNASVPVDLFIPHHRDYHDDEIDWRGCTPLHFAAAYSRSEVVQLLLDRNACVDVSNVQGYTPFHLACQCTPEKFRELVKEDLCDDSVYEATYRDRMIHEENFIDVAAIENEVNACHPYEVIREYRDDRDDEDCSIVDWSLNRKDHIQTVVQLMSAHCDVNKIDAFGNGGLYYMCYFNLKRIFARLIDAINCKRIIQIQMVKSFLDEMYLRREVLLNCLFQSCQVNLEKCYENGSILHYVAVMREYMDVYRLELLERFLNMGADVNAIDEKMQTPLHLATKMRDVGSVKILMEYNANVDCVEMENLSTPLHIVTNSMCQDSIRIIDMLMIRGADVNVKQADGKTALHNLLSKPLDYRSEFLPVFRHFLIKGVGINAQDDKGKTPLVMACTIVNEGAVMDLLRYGADVMLEDEDGQNIYQFVYGQVKSFMIAYQSIQTDMYAIFWILLKHAVKLSALGQLQTEKIFRIWQDLKDLTNHTNYQNQDLSHLLNKCHEELAILRNTKIQNNITLYNLLLCEDYKMAKLANNDIFKAIVREDSVFDTYSCYGQLLSLKYYKGCERNKLWPKAKESLIYLTKERLPDFLIEHVFMHLSNLEIRDFIQAVSLAKSKSRTTIVPLPLKVEKGISKYSRLA